MSECKLDHSQEDVINKFKNQHDYLPGRLGEEVELFLTRELPQHTLNDLFHLLKKYDLASNDEREERNRKLKQLIG